MSRGEERRGEILQGKVKERKFGKREQTRSDRGRKVLEKLRGEGCNLDSVVASTTVIRYRRLGRNI